MAEQEMTKSQNTTTPGVLTVRKAARWLAAMAASDGVVTPSERMLLKEFAENYGITPGYLLRMAHAIADEVEVPEVEFVKQSEMKGRRFEEFVVRLTSDPSRFTLLNWSSDKYVDGLYSLDTLKPDLYLRHRLEHDTVEYYVECKYRTSLSDGILDITSQLRRYRRMIPDEKELFLAIGVGGTPSKPDNFYVIPDRMVENDNVVHISQYNECLCPQTPEGFHDYVSHYFSRVT